MKVYNTNNGLYTYKAVGTVARMYANTMPDYFADAFVELMIYSQRYLCESPSEYIHFIKAPVSYHEMGRNYLVQNMRGDWLLQLDTDHTFAPDLLERLLRVMDQEQAGVVSGIYQTKIPPHNPVGGIWAASGGVHPVYDWDRHASAFPVGVFGGGCLLVKRWVFDKIRDHFRCDPFTIHPGLSEDYSFCWRCKELGIPVVLAPRIECHHVIPNVLSIADYVPPASSRRVQTVDGKVVDGPPAA